MRANESRGERKIAEKRYIREKQRERETAKGTEIMRRTAERYKGTLYIERERVRGDE